MSPAVRGRLSAAPLRLMDFAGVLAGPSLPRAACRGAPEPLWDDRVDGETPAAQEDRHYLARAICGRCEELVACLRLRRDDPTLPAGIWGGCWVGSDQSRRVDPSSIRVDRMTRRAL